MLAKFYVPEFRHHPLSGSDQKTDWLSINLNEQIETPDGSKEKNWVAVESGHRWRQ